MNDAIILSGGIGSRMRSDGFPKQYIEVCGKPILMYTLEKFEQCEDIDKIIIVAADMWQENIKKWILKESIKKFKSFALPGESRQISILNGLEKCISGSEADDKVIIHDAVRPMVSVDLIKKCLKQLDEYDGCMPVISVTDTIYFSDDGKHISNLLDRNRLFGGQSPEAFNLHKYYEINKNASEEELNMTHGTTEIAYKNGLRISMIEGEENNFKITTPTDLEKFFILIGGLKNESL